jgi:hypothetical protein
MVVRFVQDQADPRVIWMIVSLSDTHLVYYKLDIAQARKMKRDLEALIPG